MKLSFNVLYENEQVGKYTTSPANNFLFTQNDHLSRGSFRYLFEMKRYCPILSDDEPHKTEVKLGLFNPYAQNQVSY